MRTLPNFPLQSGWKIPTENECKKIWSIYKMPEHIQKHSLLVGNLAKEIIKLGKNKLSLINEHLAYASGLLHDIGKNYTIKHGGAHSQLGASIVLSHFFNPALAQAVLHHVYWPYEVNIKKHFLPLLIIYSDKRAKHDKLVSIEERFEDLFIRYGTSQQKIELIKKSKIQALAIEQQLSDLLEVNLSAYSFNCWRMV